MKNDYSAMRAFHFLCSVCVICAFPLSLRAQNPPPKSYVCYKAIGSISVDGVLDEASWSRAEWTEAFEDIEGASKPVPRFRTRVKMLWDSSFFYVGGELQEPDVWARLRQRDTVIFRDDDFEVFIDPDGDTHQYYEFEMNALNTVWDLLLIKPYRDGGPPVNGWDIKGLKTAVRISGTLNHPGDVDSGWTVELAFPWKALKECAHTDAPPRPGDQWRINYSRVEWKVNVTHGWYEKQKDGYMGKPLPEDNWVWSPQGLIDMHYPERWGFVQFSGSSVGVNDEAFVHRQSENAKWALRQVYYSERSFAARTGHFTSNFLDLGIPTQVVDGYRWPPTVKCTQSLYEAVIRSVDGKETWHIENDGRIWKD